MRHVAAIIVGLAVLAFGAGETVARDRVKEKTREEIVHQYRSVPEFEERYVLSVRLRGKPASVESIEAGLEASRVKRRTRSLPKHTPANPHRRSRQAAGQRRPQQGQAVPPAPAACPQDAPGRIQRPQPRGPAGQGQALAGRVTQGQRQGAQHLILPLVLQQRVLLLVLLIQ